MQIRSLKHNYTNYRPIVHKTFEEGFMMESWRSDGTTMDLSVRIDDRVYVFELNQTEAENLQELTSHFLALKPNVSERF